MAKIIYHNDLDGWFAATVALHSVKLLPEETRRDVGLFPMNYGEPLPIDKIVPSEPVVMVDFSPSDENEFMQLLNRTTDVVWIDHHKTAIEKYLSYNGLAGIRHSRNCAATMTWRHFHPIEPTPHTLELVEDHDLWKHQDPMSKLFATGMIIEDHNPRNDKMQHMIIGSSIHQEAIRRRIFENGATIQEFLVAEAAALVKTGTLVQDDHSINAFIVNYNGSQASYLAEYIANIITALTSTNNMEFCVILYANIAKNRKRFEMRKGHGYQDIDLGEIAQRNGGGGHHDAAGFVIPDGQMINLEIPERNFQQPQPDESPEPTPPSTQPPTPLNQEPTPEEITQAWENLQETFTTKPVNEEDLTGEPNPTLTLSVTETEPIQPQPTTKPKPKKRKSKKSKRGKK